MRSRLLPLASALLCAATSVAAQTRGPLVIHGSVVDSTGAIVPGITLRLLTRAGSPAAEVKSDSQGNFTFSSLARGDFQLSVPATSGFAASTQPLHLTASIPNLAVILNLDTVAQSIDVNPDAPATDSAANKDTVAVTADDLRKLPVFDQNYIAALIPFLDSSSLSSGGVTIIVDGVEMKSAGVSASAIQEVRINNDPYSTEFNRPGRGRIEIITKPGSPVFHGEANFLVRDAVFNARNAFATIRPPEQRRIFEGHLSGPIGRSGHTSFIASGNYAQYNTQSFINAVTSSGPVNTSIASPTTQSQISMRVTHDFSPAHRFSGGYNFEQYKATNNGVGALILPEAATNNLSREDDLLFNDRVIITPNLINQLVVTFEKDEDNVSSVTNTPSLQVSGAFTGGGAQNDVHRSEDTVHLNEVISWSHGRHYVRAGLQAPQISYRGVDDHSNRGGTFSFASLAAFNAQTPYAYTVQQGIGRGIYWINELGAFLQDQIRLTPRLQLSLGLRYDFQTYIDDYNNLAPRISVAFSPNKKTVLRGGTGLFYDRTGGDYPATFKLHNGSVLRTLQILNPTYPDPLTSGIASATPTSVVRLGTATRAPYTVQTSFSIERQIARSATLSLGYRSQILVKAFRSRDANAPILPPNPSLAATYARPDPRFGQIQQIESGGRQIGHALDLNFRGQISRWLSGQAQYTLGRVYNNTNGLYFFPQNQYAPKDEWARSKYDRLHKFDLLATINPDHWLSLGIAAALYSGLPYNETIGTDAFHTGLGNARPVGIARNTLQAGGTATVDLLWSHDLTLNHATGDKAHVLTPGISAFNILNHPNYTGYIGNISSPLFQRPTAANPGRQLQFSLGYRF